MTRTDRRRLCLLDCDGTLVDSQHRIHAAMAHAFAANDLSPPTVDDVRAIIGLSLPVAVARLHPAAEVDLQGRLTASYRAAFAPDSAEIGSLEPLYPGAVTALDALRETGWLIGLATGKSRLGTTRTLAAHGLAGRFCTIQTGDDAPSKPAPDMIFNAAAAVNVDLADVVMVGDSVFDMLMATHAGVAGVGVLWGYQDGEALRQAGAHRLIDGFDALSDALRSLEDEGLLGSGDRARAPGPG